ncbi:MAG: polysaccharide pyruvyl transferase family protein [Planctomycetaceae bacterium]|jgi:hypothetical protein|nr:polysaccharide pyruvyl transferase family protein [Planctomycetaceae bacterium]
MENQKKKIGLVLRIAKNHNNYGSSLQNYAMLSQIWKLGYDCEIIQYQKHVSLFKKLWMVIQMFRIGAYHDQFRDLKARISMKLRRKFADNIAIRTFAVNQFKKEKIEPFVRVYDGFKNLCNGSLNYAFVVVGSDQLWTPMSLYNKYYNLLFVDDEIPKISYGTSFGVSQIHKLQSKQYGEFLDRFNFVSVREISGKNIVETVSSQTAKVVLDPTMLFTREEWTKEIEISKVNTTESYIFCYLLGTNQEVRKVVNELKQKTGLKIIVIRHMDEYVATDENFGDEAPYDVSPLDFVKYISEARYVCTDSFHGSVFSILFHRQFMTFYRYPIQNKGSRNSRIDSLFKILGLENRIYKEDIFNSIQNDIPYHDVDVKIKELREDSLQYLKNSLKISVK